LLSVSLFAQQPQKLDGLDMNLGNLSKLSDAKKRSISPENFTGAKGKEEWQTPNLIVVKEILRIPGTLLRTWVKDGK